MSAQETARMNWPKNMVEMAEVIEARCRRDGYPADEAAKLSDSLMVELAQYFGGRMFYLPKGERIQIALRDRRIYLEHTGKNVQELAAKYGLSEVRVYKILEQQRRK